MQPHRVERASFVERIPAPLSPMAPARFWHAWAEEDSSLAGSGHGMQWKGRP